jgi:DNA polymerase elongation subunit (family B)
MSSFYTNVALQGKNILYRGVENGKRIARKIEYFPTFYVPSKNKSEYKTLHGQSVEPIQPGTIPDCREFLEKYKDVETFPIYGNNRYEYAFISDEFPDDVMWDIDNIRIVYLDIEVTSENGFPDPRTADQPVIAVTMKVKDKIISMGIGSFKTDREDVKYIKCDDEITLLRKFIEEWTIIWPDVISGWNVGFFDIPYLVNRIKSVFGEDEARKLSPWKRIHERKAVIMNREQFTYDIIGIATLDYLDLYKKYSYTPQESYRLDHVANYEIGEKKLDYSEHETLHQLYLKDFQKFLEYNIKDVELVERLNDKGRLIELALTLAYDNKVNIDDVFTQVRMWDTIIYNHLKKNKIVIPQMKNGEKFAAYEGAYVKDPQVGMHDWVVSFDLNSLYPHLIMQYNISMETLIEPDNYSQEMYKVGKPGVENLLNQKTNLDFLKQQNATMTPNGQFFRTDKRGLLCEIMSDMYVDRSKYKKMANDAKKKLEKAKGDPNQEEYLEKEISRYNNLQLAKKVSLNSAYGALGNKYFRFFDIRIAEAITLSGQLSIRWIENKMNEWLNDLLKTKGEDYVIASDTDSIYLHLGPLVKKVGMQKKPTIDIVRWLDKACEDKVQKTIDDFYGQLAEYVNAYDQKMIMKREAIADKAIWTAKKRYILNVWNNEGVEYKEPKLKIMGLEAVKSSTPSACRVKIKEALKVIMEKTEDDMIEYIAKFREEFRTLKIDQISFPRSVNGLTKYRDKVNMFKSATPIHVKGSIIYNDQLKKHGLTKRYEAIKEGEKIKFCYLKQPNPFMNNTIAFISIVPPEFGIDKYIDYDTQFEKSFIEPLKIVLDCINWKTEKISTLEDFFG